ncbi:MAG TPA: undecaprenyl-phosphate glucose phosphotransferase [Candidatus Kapabacteria bacterium]|nr:undecaprenyl-phosphate glucose phosphotransferase [Candidatus Kapabacteria bacterium]HYM34273.1 undecaprenyl-phosphate glucose phosphotransferase [Steroidobacteraceae bacterium]
MVQSAIALREKHRPRLTRLLALAVDLALVNLSFQLAFLLRFSVFAIGAPAILEGAPSNIYLPLELYVSGAWLVISVAARLYSRNSVTPAGRIADLFKVLGLLATAVLLYIVAQGGYNFYSRSFLFYFFLFSSSGLVIFRLIFNSSSMINSSEFNKRDILIIGAGRTGEKFYRTVSTNPNYGYHVIGFLDDNGVTSKVRPMILGKLGDLETITAARPVAEVVIALPKANEETIAALVTQCEDKCIRVNVIPNDYAAFEGKRVIEEVGEFSLVRMREAPLDQPANKIAKRLFDILFSAVILVVIFPVLFIASAILIKLSSKGPVFFKQLRTGEDGAPFVCYKFRTMRNLGRDIADSVQAVPNDPRLTWIGSILRRTNLDEIPQFWNVFKGDMSVVGPRPHMLKHTEDYRKIIGNYMVRHFVKPGVTGWAQVNGLRGATQAPEKMERRVKHDVYYIENWSFGFDLAIIGKTVVTMFEGDKNAY